MKLTEKAEEILETLWSEIVEHKKKSCDMTLLKHDETMKELLKHKLVSQFENRITLTDKGTDEAGNCVRRHRLAERLMVDVFDLKKDLVHETGCAFEHLLRRGLDESVCTLLGHPRTCPHGRAIPEGKCCRESRKQTGRMIFPLAELEAGKSAEVAYLHTGDKSTLDKLMALGVFPGTELTLLQRYPSLVFQAGKAQFAVDEELASHIIVRRN